jgi:predicted ATPase
MARRILAGDYQRMLRQQQRDGGTGVPWLDPDQVTWLEEVLRREQANMGMQGEAV